MATYRPPQTTVEVLDNPLIISNIDNVKIPAIIGLGPMVITVVDEPVVRSSETTDTLQNASNNIISITKVANTPNIASGSLSYKLISQNGALYDITKVSVSNPGKVQWTAGADTPNVGDVYYISYTYSVSDTQFNPKVYYDKESLIKSYGQENTSTGILTIAGSIVLENGSPGVMIVQASGSSYSESAYKAAIDKLQKKDNISYIVCVFPSGSVTRVQQESLINYAHTHVVSMNNIGKERGIISGSPSPYTASDGIDSIGDIYTPNTYCYRANAIKSKHHTYVVPSYATRTDANGNVMKLDGNYIAAAIAGVRSAQPKRSIPIHGFVLTGFEIENEKWNEYEMNKLGAASCCVVQSKSGVVTVRDDITTDPTSADTQEPSVVEVQRLVKETLRKGLNNTYSNKGKVIDSTTINDVAATTASLLQSLITAGEIADYGKVDNPLTGETKIGAKQNAQEPRQIDVTCSYKPLYPLKWINVTVSVYI